MQTYVEKPKATQQTTLADRAHWQTLGSDMSIDLLSDGADDARGPLRPHSTSAPQAQPFSLNQVLSLSSSCQATILCGLKKGDILDFRE